MDNGSGRDDLCIRWGLGVGIVLDESIGCITLVVWCVSHSDNGGGYEDSNCDDRCGVCYF